MGFNNHPRKQEFLITVGKFIEGLIVFASFMALPWLLVIWLVLFVCGEFK